MNRTILAVDDSPGMRTTISFTLEEAGYRVVEAKDGAEGLARIKQEQVDLVITDLNMPVLDGLSLIRAIRDNPDHRFTPIIMLTTESQDDRKQEGRLAGASGWMVKPFRPEQLLAVVRKVLK
ncbi:response regulator [Geomonas sp. Red32]|uniref:response regulator n=1 Tax=Geomonas sp. Red32 TaxID=2912856 RepID=UPI00202CC99D|nr:response regulator [Geomonas sp. Red32]MCM0083186.1 response regulator [Geomonas sp. Red32]